MTFNIRLYHALTTSSEDTLYEYLRKMQTFWTEHRLSIQKLSKTMVDEC